MIDDILKLLEDGRWHCMKEIIDNSRWHDLKTEIVVNFLSEYEFVALDKKSQKVKLTPVLCKFVKKIKVIEERRAVKELEVP